MGERPFLQKNKTKQTEELKLSFSCAFTSTAKSFFSQSFHGGKSSYEAATHPDPLQSKKHSALWWCR